MYNRDLIYNNILTLINEGSDDLAVVLIKIKTNSFIHWFADLLLKDITDNTDNTSNKYKFNLCDGYYELKLYPYDNVLLHTHHINEKIWRKGFSEIKKITKVTNSIRNRINKLNQHLLQKNNTKAKGVLLSLSRTIITNYVHERN